jgi:hypothetical protein
MTCYYCGQEIAPQDLYVGKTSTLSASQHKACREKVIAELKTAMTKGKE